MDVHAEIDHDPCAIVAPEHEQRAPHNQKRFVGSCPCGWSRDFTVRHAGSGDEQARVLHDQDVPYAAGEICWLVTARDDSPLGAAADPPEDDAENPTGLVLSRLVVTEPGGPDAVVFGEDLAAWSPVLAKSVWRVSFATARNRYVQSLRGELDELEAQVPRLRQFIAKVESATGPTNPAFIAERLREDRARGAD